MSRAITAGSDRSWWARARLLDKRRADKTSARRNRIDETALPALAGTRRDHSDSFTTGGLMKATIRRLFWWEVGLAVAATTTFLLTLLWPNWIELSLGLDPDHGSGAAEWMSAALSGAAAAGSSALAFYALRLRVIPARPATALES
jgi:hypothetical protein